MLKVRIAHEDIPVRGRLVHAADVVVVPGAHIDPIDHADGDRRGGLIDVEQGIRDRLDGIARRVTDCRRPQQRQNQVRPGLEAPDCQRLSEVLVVGGQAEPGRHVEQPADTQRAVDRHPGQVLEPLEELALEDVVDDDVAVAEVVEGVSKSRPRRLGHDRGVGVGQGLAQVLVHCGVEAEHGPVE